MGTALGGEWVIQYLPEGENDTDSNYVTWSGNGTLKFTSFTKKRAVQPKPEPGDPETPQEPLGEPEHNKTIEKLLMILIHYL